MKKPIWRVEVLTAPEAEEAVTELLERHFGAACSYRDLEKETQRVTAYMEEQPDWPLKRAELARELKSIADCGLKVGPGRISLKRVKQEDWAEAWKRHFRPFEVGPELLVKPAWSKRKARQGQAVVVVDPGLSFGTGQHPTTAFCLRQIVRQRRPGTRQSFLDIGTGSGILAIAAVKLGYRPVRGFDVDGEAIKVARANARLNSVAHRVRFSRGDLAHLPRQGRPRYSLVCANLISPLLVRERKRIAATVGRGGAVVLAGILRTEFGEVRRAYEDEGWRLLESRADKEWRSGIFVKNWYE
jgi:ribosomal protein L11 methyltransferase